MIRPLEEFHILERRAEGGWRVKARGPDLTDMLVVDFETLRDAESWIRARQDVQRPEPNQAAMANNPLKSQATRSVPDDKIEGMIDVSRPEAGSRSCAPKS
jgi:hypothetical protein